MRLHIICILIFAGILNFLPFFVSGIPLNRQLLSDAEQRLALWQDAVTPGIFGNDRILDASLKTLPPSERLVSSFFVSLSSFLHVDIFTLSVALSFVSLAVFLCGLYFLLYTSLKNRFFAFFIAFFCVIPVHCLSGDTLGFQALGFLPRDLASGIAVFILTAYFKAVNQGSQKLRLTSFFLLGLSANFYLPLFFSLFLTLLLAEIIRIRRVTPAVFYHGVSFLLGALPVFCALIFKKTAVTPVDAGLLRLYYNYMMVYPFSTGVIKYLRRFLVYAVLVPFFYFVVMRRPPSRDRDLLFPWYAVNLASFLLSLAGILIETFTTEARYFISRSSNWFMLSSMVIVLCGLNGFFREHKVRRPVFWTILVAGTLFLAQSNAVTIVRFLRTARAQREQRMDFFTAVDKLKQNSSPGDIVLTPSNEMPDIGTSVRTYAWRPLYVCYKYGGVAILDGGIARQWYFRHTRVRELFDHFTAASLFKLMRDEEIRFAFFPSEYYRAEEKALKKYLIAQTLYYAIVKYP